MGSCWSKICKSDKDQSRYNHEEVQLAGGNVDLITTIEDWKEKISEAGKDNKILVANFSTSWCGPCRAIAQAYRELADKYPSIIFLTIDVDELAEFSNSWHITATPTFFFLKNGRPLDKLVGPTKEELAKKIATTANHAFKTR